MTRPEDRERAAFVQALDGMLWDEVFDNRLRHRGDALIAYDALEARAALPATADRAERQSAIALKHFTEYFVRNYPGPDTIISRPTWHAPKIFRAAVYAIDAARAAPGDAP